MRLLITLQPSVPTGELSRLRVQKCHVYDMDWQVVDSVGCTTVMFAPRTAATVSIMQSFAAANGLAYGSDVVAAADAHAIGLAVATRPGSVGTGVVCCLKGHHLDQLAAA
eukprot:SAG31_NODE_241_length_19364_cov_17.168544_12_plen_110_part_00